MQFGRFLSGATSVVMAFCFAGLTAACHLEAVRDPLPVLGHACSLAADQERSLNPKLRELPLKVVIDREFSSGQRQAIERALEKWNAFSEQSLGLKFFELTPAEAPESQADYSRWPRKYDYCSNKLAGAFPGLLIRRQQSEAQWVADGLGDGANGVTYRCMDPRLKQARVLIVINTERSNELRLPSVALHEIGHALGLAHSCTRDPEQIAAGYVDCAKLGKHHPYREAVMYPDLHSRTYGSGVTEREILDAKEELRTNDMERAYCLYTIGSRLDRLRDEALRRAKERESAKPSASEISPE